MRTISLCSILIAVVLVTILIMELNNTFGQENETKAQNKSSKYIDYLQNARNLLNQTSDEYKNKNYTGAEDLATAAYLDNFENVEHVLEQKGSHSLVGDIEHLVREELRNLIKEKAIQSEVDMNINASDAKLLEAINLLKGTK